MTAPIPSVTRSSVAFGLRDADRYLSEALVRAAKDRAIAVVRFPAPRAAIDAPLRALCKGPSVVWSPPSGNSYGAHGAAVRIEVAGEDRFEALGRAAQEVFGAMQRSTHADLDAAAPRMFGGWSFAAGGTGEGPWEGFSDGAFVLPRWTYERGASHAALTAAVDLRDGWIGRLPWVQSELEAVWSSLHRVPAAGSPRPVITHVQHVNRARWDARIRAITEAVARGNVEKIVAARRVTLGADRDFDPWAVLRGLAKAYPKTWCFGLRLATASGSGLGAGTLLAATPERLFVKRGRTVEADALAGSVASDDPNAEAALQASDKDHREHAPVVAHLMARLAPLCQALAPVGAPEVRVLPNVLHLHTRIRGTLRPGIQAAEIAAALHPTPAVGGVPSDAAIRWIAEAEAHPRGWYTGPVGWIDADGDAELTVALRCGVIRGASAWLWAGGGIVEGSEPAAEWRESALKLRPLLEALGAPPEAQG